MTHSIECTESNGVKNRNCIACFGGMQQTTNMIQETQSKWIDINERFPEAGVFVLVTFPMDMEYSLCIGINIYSEVHGWELKTTDAYAAGITHWMPLPLPPQGNIR